MRQRPDLLLSHNSACARDARYFLLVFFSEMSRRPEPRLAARLDISPSRHFRSRLVTMNESSLPGRNAYVGALQRPERRHLLGEELRLHILGNLQFTDEEPLRLLLLRDGTSLRGKSLGNRVILDESESISVDVLKISCHACQAVLAGDWGNEMPRFDHSSQRASKSLVTKTRPVSSPILRQVSEFSCGVTNANRTDRSEGSRNDPAYPKTALFGRPPSETLAGQHRIAGFGLGREP